MPDIFDGVGDWSIAEMVAAAETSGLVGPLPLLFMTSGLRDVPQPYHGTGNATDWGNNADQWAGSQQMDLFARWLETHYGPVSLEIIHTFADGTGIYWKMGQRVDGPSFYGMDTVNAHRGHVHWAITKNGLATVPLDEGFTMDAQATAAFADLKKAVQDNAQQLVTVVEGVPAGKPNPYGLVGLKDIAKRLDAIEATLAKLVK